MNIVLFYDCFGCEIEIISKKGFAIATCPNCGLYLSINFDKQTKFQEEQLDEIFDNNF